MNARQGQIQDIAESINRVHRIHHEQHETTGLYRTVCTCGWETAPYANEDDYSTSRSLHLKELIDTAIALTRKLTRATGTEAGKEER